MVKKQLKLTAGIDRRAVTHNRLQNINKYTVCSGLCTYTTSHEINSVRNEIHESVQNLFEGKSDFSGGHAIRDYQ